MCSCLLAICVRHSRSHQHGPWARAGRFWWLAGISASLLARSYILVLHLRGLKGVCTLHLVPVCPLHLGPLPPQCICGHSHARMDSRVPRTTHACPVLEPRLRPGPRSSGPCNLFDSDRGVPTRAHRSPHTDSVRIGRNPPRRKHLQGFLVSAHVRTAEDHRRACSALNCHLHILWSPPTCTQ